MPPTKHSIGYCDFHAWRGPLQPERGHHVLETRPGLSGTDVWHTGTHGDPFTVETERLTDTYAAARALRAEYAALTREGPQIVTVGGITHFDERFQVLDVVATDVRRIVRGHVGGQTKRYEGIIVARWTLLPIAQLPR